MLHASGAGTAAALPLPQGAVPARCRPARVRLGAEVPCVHAVLVVGCDLLGDLEALTGFGMMP